MPTLMPEQIASFEENSFLRLEQVFTPAEITQLSQELDEVIQTFCVPTRGWEGPSASRG